MVKQAEEHPYLTLTEICAMLGEHTLPSWQELPELELYMDQVLSLVERYLRGYPGFDERGLTASMVNNYVKQGALPPPQKKRYSREHLAKLLVICLLKTSLPILTIHQLMAGEDIKRFYLNFCELFSDVNREIAEAYRDSAGEAATVVQCKAALRAQAEQALASHLCSVPDKDG
ncbi:MAG: DUF1836 domain-containing protein [Eubacteriales bacterium]|nr:DUF1836 domain-containing protein [Eubacteriales bacterium]